MKAVVRGRRRAVRRAMVVMRGRGKWSFILEMGKGAVWEVGKGNVVFRLTAPTRLRKGVGEVCKCSMEKRRRRRGRRLGKQEVGKSWS